MNECDKQTKHDDFKAFPAFSCPHLLHLLQNFFNLQCNLFQNIFLLRWFTYAMWCEHHLKVSRAHASSLSCFASCCLVRCCSADRVQTLTHSYFHTFFFSSLSWASSLVFQQKPRPCIHVMFTCFSLVTCSPQPFVQLCGLPSYILPRSGARWQESFVKQESGRFISKRWPSSHRPVSATFCHFHHRCHYAK